jgi:3-methyladenine DNA glycosylase AlkC
LFSQQILPQSYFVILNQDCIMAEPLKAMYNRHFVAEFSAILQVVMRQSLSSDFDTERFSALVFDASWEQRELKDRMRRITTCLRECLPARYEDALAVLRLAAPACVGFPYLIFPDFVEIYGTAPEHETGSLQALELFTRFSSAEFAVRPFIQRSPERTMAQMLAWAHHSDHHVRRLASEGCRPRLPWAMALPDFKRDPTPIFPILEVLKADESDYVRRSVANNLNDIAKDHPSLVLEIAERWKGSSPHTDWILRHGCRTLFKKGNVQALALVGVKASNAVRVARFQALQPRLRIGETLRYEFDLDVLEMNKMNKMNGMNEMNDAPSEPVTVRVDLAVDYVKANGSTSRKIFKIVEKRFTPSTQTIQRTLRFQNFTTRTHYAGEHRLTLIVNGVEAAQTLVVLDSAQ